MYVRKKNTLEIPFDFQTYMAKAEETALVDSGAMENFIDKGTMKWLQLGTKALSPPPDQCSMWTEPTTKQEQLMRQSTYMSHLEIWSSASSSMLLT
jgi:hypothetical protein